MTPSVIDVLGVLPDDLADDGRCWLQRVHDEDRAAVADAVGVELGGAPPPEGSFRIRGAGGAVAWLHRRAWSIDLATGSHVVIALRDVSSERRECESLREQALRDPLTRIWNRRGLEEMAEREVSRVRRSGEPLSVVFIDLDDFKSINDRFGHTEGDRVLRDVARAIVRALRPTDPVGRVGGDEFLALLPGASPGEARRIAERIRAAIERATARVGGSASLGVALIRGARATVHAMLQRTQSVLRQSKRCGKNRVEFGLSA